MRNLKKILALVLALMMTLSLMATASAADFTDADEIQYKEAVEVMSALKVLEGYPDGSFAPKATLNRAAAAKIVAYIMEGGFDKVEDAAAVLDNPFTDLPASWDWLIASAKYLANKGILLGYGDGTFGYNDELTAAAFGKMVLLAAGIGESDDYLGDAKQTWETKVMVALKANKLLDGMTGITAKKVLTREEASQMALNAMNFGTNVYTVTFGRATENALCAGQVFATQVDAVRYALSVHTGAQLTTGTPANDGSTFNVKTVKQNSLMADKFACAYNEDATDAFGRPGKSYTKGTSVLFYVEEPVLTYTAETTYSKVAAALGAAASGTNKGIELDIVVNGYNAVGTTGEIFKSGNDNKIGGQGTVVEIYKKSAATASAPAVYTAVVVETFVAKLDGTTNTIVPAVAASANTDAAPAYIKIAAANNKTYETASFKKDDVVLYTVKSSDGTLGSATEIVSVVKANAVVGTVTATATGYIKVNGEMYLLGAKNIDSVTIGTTNGYKVSNDTYTYYLDANNNIMAAVAGELAQVDYTFAYVIATAAKAAAPTNADDLFGTGATVTPAKAQAKIVDLATGEIKVVELGVVLNAAGNAYVYADKDGLPTGTPVSDGSATPRAIKRVYTLENGSVVLDNTVSGDTSNVTLTQKNAVIANGVYANSATKVTVLTGNKANIYDSTAFTVTSYTGIANFPVGGKTMNGAIVTLNKDKVAESVVYIEGAQNVISGANYAIYKGVGETTSTGTSYAFYVGGEVVNYLDDDDEDNATGGSAKWSAGKVYDITVDATAKKVTAAGGPITATSNGHTLTVVAVDDTFVLAKEGSTVYTIYFAATGYECYAASTYAAAELTVGSTIVVYGGTLSSTTITGADLFIQTPAS